MAEDELIQPGWRLRRSLIVEIDQAYHWARAQGVVTGSKQDFAAGLLSGGLASWWGRQDSEGNIP
jgi:hypothetical protein